MTLTDRYSSLRQTANRVNPSVLFFMCNNAGFSIGGFEGCCVKCDHVIKGCVLCVENVKM